MPAAPTPLPIHLDQVPATLAAVLARFAESGVTDAERVEFLTANLSACCQRGRTSLAPMDLLRLGLGAAKFRLLAADLTDGYVNYNKSE